MKSYLPFFIVFSLSSLYGSQDATSLLSKINYEISLVSNDSITMLKVQATFDANQKGVTDLYYNNNSWENENLFNCIVKPRLLTEKGAVTMEKDSSRIRIKHRPGLKTLRFEYFIRQDTEGDLNSDNYFRPVIQKTYFHVFSAELFIVPKKTKNRLFDITVSWNDFPQDYTIHNNFGLTKSVQKLTNTKIGTLLHGFCLGGDYRIHQLDARNNNVSLATRGQWDFLDETSIVNVLNKTVEGLDDFWKEENNNSYTVVLSPVEVTYTGSTAGGMALYQSFNAYCTDNKYTSIDQLVNVFNHELNHQWIGKKIVNANGVEQYWFSEGFTTYYTAKLVVKNAVNENDSSFFIEEINKIIKEHYSSKAKNIPNSSITAEMFWKNPDYQKIPYHRGALFAFYLDQKIQKESNKQYGLDDVMREILKEATSSGQKLTHSYFIKTVNRFLKEDIQADFKKYIEDGELLSLAHFFEEHQLEFAPTFSELKPMGLRYDMEQNELISAVTENSDAEHAGFQVGDIIIDWKKKPKPGEKAFYKVKRGEKLIEISLLRKAKVINIPQLKETAHNMELLRF